MRISTAGSANPDSAGAVEECFRSLDPAVRDDPSWLLVFHTEAYDGQRVAETLVALSGCETILGGTSCQGVKSAEGLHGLGILAISDPEGSYGVGSAVKGEAPREAARSALASALEQAGRPGEVPALIWIHAAPGHEEDLLRGIEDMVGPRVPVAGGSTADDTVAGRWSQIAGTTTFDDAVVIAALFTSVEIAYAFHSGYDPTTTTGTVTGAEGRVLQSIDGRPAAEVYNEWTGGVISEKMRSGGNVLAETTLSPLGREVGQVGGIRCYKLSHPAEVTAEGDLALFSDIDEGDEVVLMQGSRESLTARAGRATAAAIAAGDFPVDSIRGAIVAFCAGCMLAVREDIDRVGDGIRAALGDAPFLMAFTFGEQGCFVGHENSHGNLMISVVVISDDSAF